MDARRRGLFHFWSGMESRHDVADNRNLQSEVENRDMKDRILAAAEDLPPMENLIFTLRDVQDFSIEETAELTGISTGSVKTNLCYARKRIRAAVAEMQKGEQ